MATKTKPESVQEPIDKEEQKSLLDALRKLLLAGIGAVALTQETIEDFVNRLIERGEIAEKDGRKLVHEVMDKRKKETQKAEDEITKRVESVMDRMSLPSKADINTLSEKIAALSKKVDELKQK
jgi:poly(hydroxyalkanoate) granule-associated protein